METIRNYLESMFAGLPNTPEVMRAKDELWQMMDDRFEDLMRSGKTENEAVGAVIAEFGNLDELAETLGLSGIMQGMQSNQPQIHMIGIEEAKDFISASVRSTTVTGISVLLFICSVIIPILAGTFEDRFANLEEVSGAVGIAGFFVCIALGVGMLIYNASRFAKWDYIKKEFCGLETMTGEYVQNLKSEDGVKRATMLTIGIMLCVLCVVPAPIFDALGHGSEFVESLGGVFLFLMVGIGVMLIIWSGAVEGACKELLKANERSRAIIYQNQASAQNRGMGYSNVYNETAYSDQAIDGVIYENPTVRFIMSIYWPTITCIYLIWSFLTFQWFLSWIIWPIAGVVHGALKSAYGHR